VQSADYDKHREERLAQKREYFRNLPDDKREKKRLDHLEWQRRKAAAKPKQWEVRAPSAYQSTRFQNWKARKMGVTGTITAQEWAAVCERYGGICLCCRELKPLTLDHIVPLTRGGLNVIENAQPLCFRCNNLKRCKSVDFRPLFEPQLPTDVGSAKSEEV